MVTDQQVRRLIEMVESGMSKVKAAAKAGMCRETAQKYIDAGKLPSEMKKPHTWNTRKDPFEDEWPWCEKMLEQNPALKTPVLFKAIQRRNPGKFKDSQIRTLFRRVAKWRATEGPGKEVYFDQVHEPGKLASSDFTHMKELGITIAGQPFDHLLYHFTLTYSNWEWASICYSESMESLMDGFQEALWQLGGTPQRHRTDQLSAAVNNLGDREQFKRRYKALMGHYGIEPEKTQPDSPNENGDIEKRNGDLKEVVDQLLMLRGSRDFDSIDDYKKFLHQELRHLNRARSDRLKEEKEVLGKLPLEKMSACKHYRGVRVSKGSTIRIDRNTYSVPSRLVGKKVNVRQHSEVLLVYYGRQKVECLPRLRGRNKVYINYRHIIDSLVRKPGAFLQYRYRDELFPTSRFRMAWDELKGRYSERGAARRYLEILHLAAMETESGVDRALQLLQRPGERVTVDGVKKLLEIGAKLETVPEVKVDAPDLSDFDQLFSSREGQL